MEIGLLHTHFSDKLAYIRNGLQNWPFCPIMLHCDVHFPYFAHVNGKLQHGGWVTLREFHIFHLSDIKFPTLRVMITVK